MQPWQETDPTKRTHIRDIIHKGLGLSDERPWTLLRFSFDQCQKKEEASLRVEVQESERLLAMASFTACFGRKPQSLWHNIVKEIWFGGLQAKHLLLLALQKSIHFF